MVMCKYFLEGRCMFGENCRNEHAYDNSNRRPPAPSYYSATTAGRQSSQQQQQTLRSMHDVKQVILEEIRNMEAGQWPFSCFSPLKDEHLIPGMDDLSPEELRLEAYEAQNKNNLDGYKMKVAMLTQEYQNKRNQLLNMDANLFREIFIEKSNTAPGSFSQTSSPFGASSATNTSFQSGGLFGNQPTTTTSTFSFSTLTNSGQQPSQSVFGGGASFSQASSTFAQPAPFAAKAPVSSIFGQAPASSVFGQTSAAAPPPAYGAPPAYGQSGGGLFGQATSTTNVFGQQSQPSANVFSQVQPTASTFTQPQSNLFVQASQPTSTANVFGQAQPASTVFGQPASTTSNVFGQIAASANVFGGANQSFQSQTPLFGQNQFTAQPQTFTDQTPQKSVFASQTVVPTTPPSNVFSQTAPTNAFTTPPANAFAQQSNTFNTPAQNVFTSQAQPQNAFTTAASTTPQTNAFSQPNNPFTQTAFAQQQSEKSNPFTQAAVSQNHYSKLEDLTEEEIAAFKADEFVLGKIPTKPPPLEMA